MKSAEKSSSWVRPVGAGLFIAAVLVVLLVAGYLPRRNRERNLVRATDELKTEVPEVTVDRAERSPALGDVTLPGNVTPLTEALINARASGYIQRRLVDIGDRVSQGQLLAEIDSPELDEQVLQAAAGVSQAKAALAGAVQLLRQANARLNLARVTADRWRILVQKGVVSRQESDQGRRPGSAAGDGGVFTGGGQSRGRQRPGERGQPAPADRDAGLREGDSAVRGDRHSAQRGHRLADSRHGRAAVVSHRADRQAAHHGGRSSTSAAFVRVGSAAEVTFQELPGRRFTGKISRTANALEPSTRTLPTEVEVANPGGVLLPNMFAQVRLLKVGTASTALIPGDALIVRPNGTQVAIVTAGNRIHFQPIELGRDFGQFTEVRAGLSGDEVVVVNATDDVREGAEVKPLMRASEAAPGTSQAPSSGARGSGPNKSGEASGRRP